MIRAGRDRRVSAFLWAAPFNSQLLAFLGIIRVGDRPGEALDELLCRVIVAEVGGVDLLIEQHRGLLNKR